MTSRRKSVAGDAASIRFSQIAPWNSRLTNPYRTRWCQVEDRMFKVHSDSLDGIWFVDEVDADGNELGEVVEMKWIPAGLSTIAFTLAEAKVKIAAACGLDGLVRRVG